ncbi:MAG: tRNA (adenosine(37)-N6)-threonylcarbamoyltransferase complex ATPase subunit type 1 TsaE [Pseudomonadota bacterium]
METLGGQIGQQLQGGEIIHLQGELGAGKTTLVRGLLQTIGYCGNVKSPTYTLVENYELDPMIIYHFDLYRLTDPEELEDMGIRDYCQHNAVCLFEWPEQGQGVLPDADLEIQIDYLNTGRRVELISHTQKGNEMLTFLAAIKS